MNKRVENALLLGLLVTYIKEQHKLKPSEVIRNFNKDQVAKILNEASNELSSKEKLIEMANLKYKNLKIK